jgi:PadR family transcriptional regulator PadR
VRSIIASLDIEWSTSIKTLQGTIDLIVLRTLVSMGPQHAYGIAARVSQVSGNLYSLNQGTLYPALVRLEQRKWIKGKWGATASGREAKFYSVTRLGQKILIQETRLWRQFAGVIEKLLSEGV